jgi:hypothetical protein
MRCSCVNLRDRFPGARYLSGAGFSQSFRDLLTMKRAACQDRIGRILLHFCI